MKRFSKASVFLVVMAFLAVTFGQCIASDAFLVAKKNKKEKYEHDGSPPHAKAYGKKAKHAYRFYPAAKVYYNPATKLYYYPEGSEWRTVSTLPPHFANLGKPVNLSLESEQPYVLVEEHLRQYSGVTKTVTTHTYRYYPVAQVYFDNTKRVYYFDDGGAWRHAAVLPPHLKSNLGQYVVVKSKTDTPYIHIEEHRKKYPPGQLKKRAVVYEDYVKVPPGQLKKKHKK